MSSKKIDIFLWIIIVLVFLLNISPLYAQGNLVDDLVESATQKEKVDSTQQIEEISETEKKVTSQYFDILLVRGNQSAFTGKVTYTAQITAHIDSPRTQIEWSVPNSLKIPDSQKEKWVGMKKDSTHTVKVSVKAERSGVYPITVTVNSWQHNTNYTNSASDDMTFDKALVLQPTSSSYVVGNIGKYLSILLVAIVAVFVAIRTVKKFSPKAKKWLTPPV